MIISNVYDYFKKLQAKGKCKPALEWTVEATGVTAPTIQVQKLEVIQSNE